MFPTCRQDAVGPSFQFQDGIKMHALGVSLIVGGMAFLFGGLLFLFPTKKISEKKPSFEESQQEIEYHLRQMRNERDQL